MVHGGPGDHSTLMHLYLATGNAHKVSELTAILANARVPAQVFPASAVGGMPEVVEDAGTFEGNARKKALALLARMAAHDPEAAARANHRGTGCALAVADDSGLCVDALEGAPGVESAYFAGHPSNDAANNAKLLELLREVPAQRRTAAFHCCIVAATMDARTFVFTGQCPGRVLTAPRGVAGFGYDPLFVPDGEEATAAELPPEIKNRISHRARALAQFIAWLDSPRGLNAAGVQPPD